MRYLLILLILLVTGCADVEPKKPPLPRVNVKYCIDGCMHKSFEMFGKEGHSWGAGSSSMNGLTQEKIFDRVQKYCERFYKGEACCHGNLFEKGLSQIHSYDYGTCELMPDKNQPEEK